jgi:hypothetical protein
VNGNWDKYVTSIDDDYMYESGSNLGKYYTALDSRGAAMYFFSSFSLSSFRRRSIRPDTSENV